MPKRGKPAEGSTKRKPRIGITLELSAKGERRTNFLDLAYAAAVTVAGGMPLHFPSIPDPGMIREIVEWVDGLVLTGGADIHPSFYREEVHPLAFLGPKERVDFDIQLFQATLKAKKPILAICHGLQIANVALGGTLYQDIPTQVPGAVPHRGKETRAPVRHLVRTREDSHLFQWLKGLFEFEVQSLHHQAVKDLGQGLRASAESPDGLIEGLELPTYPQFVGVQWHPEEDPQSEPSRRLFNTLIQMASADHDDLVKDLRSDGGVKSFG